MLDLKNILLAWVSSITTVFAAIEGRTVITIISAIVLPVVFFTVGKTVDVCVQIYFRIREEKRRNETGGQDLPPRVPRSAATPPIQEGSLESGDAE